MLLTESFDFSPRNQYILWKVSPSCFRFENVFPPNKSAIKMRTEIFYVLMLEELVVVQTDRGQTCLRVVNVICTDLDSFAFTLHFLSQRYIVIREIMQVTHEMKNR